MKNRILKYITAIVLMFSVSACSDVLDINRDPDESPTARPNELLTAGQAYLHYLLDARLNQRGALWAQYWTWGPAVALGDVERYLSIPADYNGIWRDIYSDAAADLDKIVDLTEDNPGYTGVAKVMLAYTFQLAVDYFGDVPFSQALQGAIEDGGILAPEYDDDQAVYAGILTLLDEAKAELEQELLNPSVDPVGANDLIYGGDLSAWIKFANSLKLRVLMRQSAVVDITEEVNALLAENNFIETNAEAATFEVEGVTGGDNPRYANFLAGIGNFYVASNASLEALSLAEDPRIDAFYDFPEGATEHAGIDQGDVDEEPFSASRTDYSTPSDKVYRQDEPVMFMSAWEVWFLRAEAALNYSSVVTSTMAFEMALQTNFDYLATDPVVDGENFITNNVTAYDALSNDQKFERIGRQKWIAMNGIQEGEAWIETRRFDTPSNPIFTSPTQGLFQIPAKTVLGDQFPSIFLYPSEEQSLNANFPGQRANELEKVFWDN